MPPDHASGRLPGTTSSSRKRAYITCSTGSWQLGKTIGAGSMGKVKLARNQETGEQVGPYAIMLCPNLPSNIRCRLLSRSSHASLQTNIARLPNESERIIPRRFEPRAKQLSSAWSITRIFVE
jgi:hypothetical protein